MAERVAAVTVRRPVRPQQARARLSVATVAPRGRPVGGIPLPGPPEASQGRLQLPAPYTSLRCSACGWIDKNSRKSQAEFVCSSCGFACNADTNASINVAAGQGGIPRPRRTAGAGGTTPPTKRSSVREPQPVWVGIPLF